jgi:hypothetical protein
MKRPFTRRCLFGGALVVAAAVWAFDRLAGDRQPRAAQAARSAAAPLPAAALAGCQPVADLVGRLAGSDYVPVAEELNRLERDLFLPTAAIKEAVAPHAPAPGEAVAATAGNEAAVASDFRTRHKLNGVLVGDTPLAVVDNRVLAIHSDLDGYTLTDVQRDYVVFRNASTGERLTLELEPGPRTP